MVNFCALVVRYCHTVSQFRGQLGEQERAIMDSYQSQSLYLKNLVSQSLELGFESDLRLTLPPYRD